MRFSVLPWLAGATLSLTLTACPRKYAATPYYQFTTADREWMTFQPGTIWTFESSKGARNRFRVDSALVHEHRARYGRTFSGGYSTDPYLYQDDYLLRVSSLDSAGQVGNFVLTCAQPDGASNTILAAGSSEWATFIGIDSGVGGFIPCWMPFPADLRQASFQELTVGGRRYPHVLALNAVGQPTRYTTYGLRTSVRQLYYDQQAGVVRLVADNGEVWNRVP